MNAFMHVATRSHFWVAALFLLVALGIGQSPARGQQDLVSFAGQTMGTTYSIKIAPPHDSLPDDLRFQVDAELRTVNDQMSTYLKSSEISQFNASDSTDWFDVSDATALVVKRALEISELTDGGFDVTVGPLVDAWSFGPAPRSNQIPDDATLERLKAATGYSHLHVRLQPPALRKDIPDLRIDLSAIAKGHGVDRIVELLQSTGAENVFVEIGGEIRTTGAKPTGPWMVGIQAPDQAMNRPAIAHGLTNGAIATSGDYRNFFMIDGVRYSHTIDPRTGRPVKHDVASVSVITDDCMSADAWATAINVLGPDAGIEAAKAEGLDVLVIHRNQDGYDAAATGQFQPYVDQLTTVKGSDESNAKDESSFVSRVLPLAVVTAVFMGIVVTGMAVGVMFGRRAISGSCGGLNSKTNPDGSTSCSLCSNPSDACKELREKMQADKSAAENVAS
ncbi:FAD:protein FMN transferase [Crateriforma spongiae]|uniref:FAD:protein FMN transferase n=1 Tax=Crateriforma spongiae TaxID=2724528 RepID=UPI001F370F10|nr:FAD:protein FMN transferase [Crateriforma spongiae]